MRPGALQGLDIGPDSVKSFGDVISNSQTVIWNGPMGVFEFEKFSKGTFGIADALAGLGEKGVTTIIGGGSYWTVFSELEPLTSNMPSRGLPGKVYMTRTHC